MTVVRFIVPEGEADGFVGQFKSTALDVYDKEEDNKVSEQGGRIVTHGRCRCHAMYGYAMRLSRL